MFCRSAFYKLVTGKLDPLTTRVVNYLEFFQMVFQELDMLTYFFFVQWLRVALSNLSYWVETFPSLQVLVETSKFQNVVFEKLEIMDSVQSNSHVYCYHCEKYLNIAPKVFFVFVFSSHTVCQEHHHHSGKEQTRIGGAAQKRGLLKTNLEGKKEFIGV